MSDQPNADRCVVEVGIHPPPYWISDTGVIMCDRHRHQYDERDDLTRMNWRRADV